VTAVVELKVQRTIAAPPEQVFEWLADPASLKAVPLVLWSRYAEGSSGPGLGAVREVTGAGLWFREEYTAYDPPRSYSYLILRSFPVFDHEGGTLSFTPTEQGTHVDWVTRYTHPAWAGGTPLGAVSRRLLERSFLAVLDGCATRLETP
jgi:uncharacterized protein YndB with AHSA1/START domain